MYDQNTIQDASSAPGAAAMWWVEALIDPKLDDGTTDPGLLKMIALRKSITPPHSGAGLAVLQELLVEKLDEMLGVLDGADAVRGVTLTVGHHPDHFLRECGLEAGLNVDIASWPWQTMMTVTKDEVTVRNLTTGVSGVVWRNRSIDA